MTGCSGGAQTPKKLLTLQSMSTFPADVVFQLVQLRMVWSTRHLEPAYVVPSASLGYGRQGPASDIESDPEHPVQRSSVCTLCL